MLLIWPIVGLVLFAIAVLLSRRFAPPEAARRPTLEFAVLASLILLGLWAISKFAPSAEITPDRYGLLIGALTCAVSGWFANNNLAGGLCGIAGACVAHGAPGSSNTLIVGGLFVLAIVGVESRTRAAVAMYVATIVTVGNDLGRMGSPASWASMEATIIAIGVALVGAVVLLFAPKSQLIKTGLVLLLLAGLSYLLGKTWIHEDSTWLCLSIGSVAGVVIHWVTLDDEPDALRTGIAGLIAIALGTASYGIGRGEGMALALVPAAGALILLDNLRGLAATAPLAALVVYRIFRERFPETARAFDIGQHYSVMGLLLGMILPLLPSAIPRRYATAASALPALWGVALAGSVAASGLFFGTFGMIGVMIGAGFAPLVAGLRKTTDWSSTGLSVGVAGTTVLAYQWLGKTAEITRDQKIHLLGYGVGITVVLAALITTLSQDRESSDKGRQTGAVKATEIA